MKNISIIGGDNRNLILSNLLESEGYNIFRYALGDKDNKIEDCINNSDFIITSTPFSVDLENLYCPLGDKQIKIDEFINLVHKKTIIAGGIKEKYIIELEKNENKVIDLMKNDQLAIMNAIPTAEGVAKLIIENTKITINESNIAVLGFGRVGKRIAKLLNAMGANIFCFDIKKEEVANINLCGYNVLEDFYKDFKNMDIIVNTVPQKILGEKELNSINKKSLIIDVSSKPGGVDFEYANKCGYNVIHALGLPGKVAPETSAKYIKDIVKNLII